uniref:Uncharacterized protein n=1 Tax=Fagus sylvatica TaxID=28930 RepID=A0A2N9GVQ5_FAGSY
MQTLKRLTHQASSTRATLLSAQFSRHHEKLFLLPSQHLAQRSSNRFLDIYQLGNKAAIRERACSAGSADEMNRGYFADIKELEKHGGKLAMANKIIIPAMAAVKFPALEVNYSDGKTVKLPITSNGDIVDADKSAIPKVSLLCLSFRANSQLFVSWNKAIKTTMQGKNEKGEEGGGGGGGGEKKLKRSNLE